VSSSGTFLQPAFFVTGGTLPRDAPSYIRREADERLYSSLRRGDICYALTPRQMGKSSLMVQTAARLRERGVSVAILDLTALGQNLTPDQWYYGLVGRIGQQLGLEDELEAFWDSHAHLGPFQRFAAAIQETVLRLRIGRVVIFIDEIDAVRSLPFSTDEFFAGIREFFNRRTQDPELSRLTFCLLGVATPSDLIRDTRTTPFNIGVRVELSDFTVEEAAPLAQGLCTDQERGRQLIQRILYWTGGQPYLTQRLCQFVSKQNAATAADVDQVCGELFLSNRARERDDNLLFVRERMLRNEGDLAGLLLLYGKVRIGARVPDDETNPMVTVLRLAGIVRVEGGYLRVRNRIYAEVFNRDWVSENLPGAEVRRQRAAYFRGFRIAALAVAFLASLAGAYYLQKILRADTTPPPPRVKEPPAFWASFGAAKPSLPSSKSGSLLVSAGNADVAVFINGAPYGRTDKQGILQVPLLPEGEYDVRLEKPGFRSFLDHVPVSAQHETRMSASLSPQSLVAVQENLLLIKQAPPETKLSVDRAFAGVTNGDGELSVKLQPGEHDITLEKSGYLPRNFKAHLSPGTNVIDGKLQPDREAADLDAALRSNDLANLQDFLNHYPGSKSTAQIRAKMEDLEWAKDRDTNDPNELEAFIERFPNGQHLVDARRLADQLEAEDVSWRSALAANTLESLQAFVGKYPHSRHAPDARTAIALLKDQSELLQLLHDYQDAYNRHDLKQFLQLWPDCPSYVQSEFKNKRSGTIVLAPKENPGVDGDSAWLKVTIRKQTETGDSSKTVPFQFKKENDHWVVKTGSL